MTTSETLLSSSAVQEAADILSQRRRHGTQGARLPDTCRPTDLASALAIQQHISSAPGINIAGWKCGMPSGDRIVVAALHQHTVFRQSDHIRCTVHARRGCVRIEPEIAFVIARDLPYRSQAYDIADIRQAIGSAHLALELIDTRYADADTASFYEHLADSLFNAGIYLGPAITPEAAFAARELDIRIRTEHDTLLHQQCLHPAGDPLAPLIWLQEFLRSREQGLSAGDIVITGSYAGSPDVPLQTQIDVTFGALGHLQVWFEALPADQTSEHRGHA